MFSDDDTARSRLTDQPQEGLHSKSGVSEQVALVVKNLPANAGDVRNASLILGSGRSPTSTFSPRWTSLNTMGSWVRDPVLAAQGSRWAGVMQRSLLKEAASRDCVWPGDSSHRQI